LCENKRNGGRLCKSKGNGGRLCENLKILIFDVKRKFLATKNVLEGCASSCGPKWMARVLPEI